MMKQTSSALDASTDSDSSHDCTQSQAHGLTGCSETSIRQTTVLRPNARPALMPSQPRQSASVTDAAAKTPNAVPSESSQQAISRAGSCESSSAPWRASRVNRSAAHRLVPHATAPPMTPAQGRAWRLVRARRTISSATCGRYRHSSSAIASNANRTGEAPMNFPLRGDRLRIEAIRTCHRRQRRCRDPERYRCCIGRLGEQLNVFAHPVQAGRRIGKFTRFCVSHRLKKLTLERATTHQATDPSTSGTGSARRPAYDRADAASRKPPPLSLAERLKLETRPLHVDVERSALIAALLRGRLDRLAYLALLRNLQAIYAALEPALQHHATHPPWHRSISMRWPASLRWQPTLRHCDPGVAAGAGRPLEPATIDYVDRLAHLDRCAPELLVAHAYVAVSRRFERRATAAPHRARCTAASGGPGHCVLRLRCGARRRHARGALQGRSRSVRAVRRRRRRGRGEVRVPAPPPAVR